MLRSLSEKKKRKFYEENLGHTSEVLFEEDIENGMMHGFTENYVRVEAKYDPVLINETKKVQLTSIAPSGYVAIEEVNDRVLVH